MKKKTKKQKKSPRNLRTITEWKKYLDWRSWLFWVNLLSLALISAVVMMGVEFYQLNQKLQRQNVERQSIQAELGRWEKIIEKYPNYRDAYFKAAVLEYRLKNDSTAKEYLQKALELDPSFEEGRKLEKLLISNY